MSDIAKVDKAHLLGLLHKQKGSEIDIPKPFSRDILLFSTFVAGTTFVEGMEELEPYLKIDERLEFLREPSNPHDENAILVNTANGTKIGYVPMKDNIVFARLMDAGKLLFGKIVGKKKEGSWVKIDINVYLHE